MKRILIVDDNPDILEVLKSVLEMKAYEVQTLSNGQKIFDTIKKVQPDLILLDVYLAGYNGIDVCTEIKSRPNLNNLKIIMMSAHSNLDVMMQNCKPDAFIPKPFHLPHLLEVIENLLLQPGE